MPAAASCPKSISIADVNAWVDRFSPQSKFIDLRNAAIYGCGGISKGGRDAVMSFNTICTGLSLISVENAVKCGCGRLTLPMGGGMLGALGAAELADVGADVFGSDALFRSGVHPVLVCTT